MKTHYAYLPGLGDGLFNRLRRLILAGWKLRGLSVSFIDLNWSRTDETAEDKYRRVVEHIKQCSAERTILIGESAGGSMAMRVYLQSELEIERVITICGYNQHASSISPQHSKANPAFIPTVSQVDSLIIDLDATKANKITNYYSPSDEVVGFEHSKINGAKVVKLPSLPHVLAISYFLIRTIFKGL